MQSAPVAADPWPRSAFFYESVSGEHPVLVDLETRCHRDDEVKEEDTAQFLASQWFATDAPEIYRDLQPVIECIEDPDSPALVEAYAMLSAAFREGEVEPLTVFQRELGQQDPSIRYVMHVARERGRIISIIYSSVQLDGDECIAALRFTLTAEDRRGMGVHRPLIEDFFQRYAREYAAASDQHVTVKIAEIVDKAESLGNRHGMHRLYYPGTAEQVRYEIPPIEWDRKGNPLKPGIPENLQVWLSECGRDIPVERLVRVLRSWWEKWYVRPREDFETDAAWEQHRTIVMENILEKRVIGPILQRECSTLTRISRKDFRREYSNECRAA